MFGAATVLDASRLFNVFVMNSYLNSRNDNILQATRAEENYPCEPNLYASTLFDIDLDDSQLFNLPDMVNPVPSEAGTSSTIMSSTPFWQCVDTQTTEDQISSLVCDVESFPDLLSTTQSWDSFSSKNICFSDELFKGLYTQFQWDTNSLSQLDYSLGVSIENPMLSEQLLDPSQYVRISDKHPRFVWTLSLPDHFVYAKMFPELTSLISANRNY